MSLLNMLVNSIARPPRIESFQRFLFLGPHPDDIEIGAGATAARLAAEGKQICFLICTDGRYGTDGLENPPGPEQLASWRRREAQDSAARLGVEDVRFLDYSDGGFYRPEDLTQAIAEQVSDFQPDVIFAPDPDVSSECHPDHLNVGRAAKQLALTGGNAGIMNARGLLPVPVKALALYMTANANQFIRTDGYLQLQLESIFACHRSQFPDGVESGKMISLYLKLRAVDFGLRCLGRTAEGFRVLGNLQMHCFPEAGA